MLRSVAYVVLAAASLHRKALGGSQCDIGSEVPLLNFQQQGKTNALSFFCLAAAEELGCPVIQAPAEVQFSAAADTASSSGDGSSPSSSVMPAPLWQQARMGLSGRTAAALVAPGEPSELGEPDGDAGCAWLCSAGICSSRAVTYRAA